MSSVAAIAMPWPWTPGAQAALTARNAVLLNELSNRLVRSDEQSSKLQNATSGGAAAGAAPTCDSAELAAPVWAADGGTDCSGSSRSSACRSDSSSVASDWLA